MGAGESKAKCGSMQIVLSDDTWPVFVAGQTVTGEVHLNLTGPCFPADKVTIGICGQERVAFTREKRRNKKTYYEDYEQTEVICMQLEPCFEFIDGAPRLPGNYRYPFSFVIPKELPASKKLRMNHEQAELDVRYFFVCEVPPRNKKDWAQTGLSSLSGGRPIVIQQFDEPAKPIFKEKSLQAKVGGFCCFGKTPCFIKAALNKDQYKPGDQVQVKLNCDNSQCLRDVVSFKIKLLVHTSGTASPETRPTATSTYLLNTKYLGKCNKQERFDGILQTKLPEYWRGDILPTSYYGELITVHYSLVIFVKHAGMCEFGEGHEISFPIKMVELGILTKGADNEMVLDHQISDPLLPFKWPMEGD